MDVVSSSSSLRATSVLWQPRPNAWVLTAVCKATFVLAPGESKVAEDPERPSEDDAYWDGDESKSLQRASDLAPFKPRADVVLVGNAYAPRKQPAASIVARLLVGDVDKSIEVFADRAWAPDGTLREGPRFTRMPLRYERAAGGPGTPNPVGIPPNARPDMMGMVAIPNLQPAGLHVASPRDVIPIIGFGPIAPTWPSRLEKLGRWAASWSPRAWFQQPIPDGIDRSYFNVAPRDQQVEALRSNERIILENLHPDHARLITSLPGLSPRAVAEHASGVREDVELYCDTLVIDTDQGRCTLTWRGQMRLEHPSQPGRLTISTGGAAAVPALGNDRTADLSSISQQLGALPFNPQMGAPPAREAPRPLGPSSAGATMMTDRATGNRILPFGGGGDAGPPPAPPPPPPPMIAQPAWTPPPSPDPVAPPPLVRAPMTTDPIAPSIGNSPWIGGDPGGNSGRSVGQMVAFQASEAAVTPLSAREAALDGVAAASDAAAGGAASAVLDDDELEDDASPDTARPALSAPPREIVTLLWFEPKALPRMRRKARWRQILEDLELDAPDEDLDAGDARTAEQEGDRRDALAILTRGEAADAMRIQEAVADATRRDGSFVEPLVLTAGDLAFPFDEIETLKATVAVATPLVGDDKNLRATIDLANEVLKTPAWLQGSAGGADQLTSRVKEAFAAGRRMVPAGYLEAHSERMLLEQRHYQKRTVFGKLWLRALFRPTGSQDPIPAYLPENLAKELPMFQRFAARLVAEVHFQQDQYEVHPSALRVVAVARVMPPVGRR